jgi:hypothetical protein
MSSYKGHIVGGVAAFCFSFFAYTTLYQHQQASALELFLFCLFGSLFPDIDTKSKIQMLLYRSLAVGFVALLIMGYTHALIAGGFAILLPLIVPHRSIFHNKWFITAFVAGIAAWAGLFYPHYIERITTNALFFLIGMYSHLILDFGLVKTLKI